MEDNFNESEQPSKPTYPTPMSKHESCLSKRQRVSFSTSDPATKRVIAPYVKVIRKGQKADVPVVENKQFSFYLQKKPSVLLRSLSAFLSDSVDLPSLLHETSDVLLGVTKSRDVTLYMVDEAVGEIYISPRNVLNGRHKINWKIEPGTTVAAFVAFNKEYVMINDIIEDVRFPDGIGYTAESVKSVLCVPVVTPDDDCFAIIELCRDVTDEPFDKNDLKIVIVVTGWMGAAIHQNQQRLAYQKQQELNDYLLDLTKCYFADTVLMEKMITEIVSFAKTTLGAERGSFFIIDKDSDEFVADLFDEGIDDSGESSLHKKHVKIRFNKDRGIAGLVARTGVTVNIKDAYNDPRFNKEVDQKTGFITRSILCMPIMGIDGILGVVQVINKQNGPCFTHTDENLFKTFSVYCALALHYARLHNLMDKKGEMSTCLMDMLKFQMKPCKHDVQTYYGSFGMSAIPENFDTFSWYITPELVSSMPHLVMNMFCEIIGVDNLDIDATMEFILTVRKSYRNNPYHNFEHAFNVCHCMYNILGGNSGNFDEIETQSLIIAALCHDLDHKGFTNNFLQLTNNFLTRLYDESPLENHHYEVTMLILQNHKMLKNLTEENFVRLSANIKEDILATDLTTYFKSRPKLMQINQENSFDWDSQGHRSLLKAMMMTCADLSGQGKPFHVSKKITDALYREFYLQGDIEKSMSLCPLSMMDREKQHLVPEDQVQFLSVVVLPCAELLAPIFPNTENLLRECLKLMDTWREIIELRGQKCWHQEDSVASNDEDLKEESSS